MTDLAKMISYKDYKTFAGPDWPSYQAIIEQKPISDNSIRQEVDKFVKMMTQTYQELTLPGSQLAWSNQQRQRQIFFDKKTNIEHSCDLPWNTLGINANGEIFICNSPSWIPKFVGNIQKIDNIYDALNSDIALKIRNEIIKNRYFYCNNEICSFFKNIPVEFYNTQPDNDSQSLVELPNRIDDQLKVSAIPNNIIFDFDYTCNFKCPSCRTELINNNKHHVIRKINDNIVDKIKTLIIDKIDTQPISIRWCGGEPFISESYLSLMNYILDAGKENIQHIIQTNGSYLQTKQDLLQRLLPSTQDLRVSFDAASEATYHKIRINGQWELLLDNVRWLIQIVSKNNFRTKITADFVVQLDNYKEIPLFVELCAQLGIEHINFQKMWNWGTWPQDVFDSKNIYNPKHSKFYELQNIFKQINREILV